MRLIGTFDTEKEAYSLQALLLQHGIESTYEPFADPATSATRYRIWIYSEEDLDKGLEVAEQFRAHPEALPATPPSAPEEPIPPVSISQLKVNLHVRKVSFLLTHVTILLCAFLFFWNSVEKAKILKDKGVLAAELEFSSLQETLLFDFPNTYVRLNQFVDSYPMSDYKELKELPPDAQQALHHIEEIPFWHGLYAFFLSVQQEGWATASKVPLFEKIKQGQLYRLFTPCLMHRDLLHILFNMVWAWILLRQIEVRLSKLKTCLLILVLGILPNCAQYFISGPNFLGFSGVVVGLAAFIWMRQRRAPWEGYPLQRGTVLFLALFVVTMVVLEAVLFSIKLFSSVPITPVIANTAHVVGGLCGLLCGRISFFSRSPA